VADKPSLREIVAKAFIEAHPGGGVLNEIISGLQDRHQWNLEHTLGAITARVGEDAFLSIVDRNPEIEALLMVALAATARTGVESKRKLMQQVVVNAMTSNEPIDMEQLKIAALADLDAPHFRALVRLVEAEHLGGKARKRDEYLSLAVKREPVPVIAALVRTGAVYSGSLDRDTDGPARRGQLHIPGVTDFGYELIADLTDNGWPQSHYLEGFRFERELKAQFRSQR
jgi:hypothetical protein